MPTGIELDRMFAREINRISDADRNARKRGLQKLLDELPWTAEKKAVNDLFLATLKDPVFIAIADPIEKCRDLSLQILLKAVDSFDDITPFADSVLSLLYARVGDTPFPEPAEELRLQVGTLIQKIFTHKSLPLDRKQDILTCIPSFLTALSVAIKDSFPAAKTQLSSLVTDVAPYVKFATKKHAKDIIKSLAGNAMHQHSKVRSATLKSLCRILQESCGNEDFESNLKEIVLPLTAKLVADRSGNTRKELALFCGNLLTSRIATLDAAERITDNTLIGVDTDLLVQLILVAGDESEEIVGVARGQLREVSIAWANAKNRLKTSEGKMHVVTEETFTGDAEEALQKTDETVFHQANNAMDVVIQDENIDDGLILKSMSGTISDLLVAGVGEWTAESRSRYLRGLRVFLSYSDETIATKLLPNLLSSLGAPLRDEEAGIRQSAELCCHLIGRLVSPEDVLNLLIPRLKGVIAGGDTWSQRCAAAHLLSNLMKGYTTSTTPIEKESDIYLSQISDAIASVELYEHREAELRESILLLVRNLITCVPTHIQESQMSQKNLAICLIYLQGPLPGETSLVRDAAATEAKKLSELIAPGSIPEESIYASKYFVAILDTIAPRKQGSAWATGMEWDPYDHNKAAYDVLIRACTRAAWENYEKVLPIIYQQVQPPEYRKNTPYEDHLAQTGQEVIKDGPEVDVRLSLLALLEGLLRSGSADWKCGQFIGTAGENIIRKAVLPNLVWRVGRVDATIRKVALAVCYGLLKSGGALPQSLFDVAGELLPLLCSNLDDHEVSPRMMACMCVTVILERLRGAFAAQSLSEMYPLLLKRLDDSSDQVRLAICTTLESFFQCAPKENYNSTLLDYSLDQLFVHLDDRDADIQQGAFNVIKIISEHCNRELVMRKAESARHTHRDEKIINRLTTECQGFEVLSERQCT